jgi:hypothetical protein
VIEFETGIVQVLAACAAVGRPFFVGGSVAAMAYGEPRATADVDVVIDATGADAEALQRAFPEEGWYIPPPDVLRRELGRGSHGSFNLLHHATGLKVDVYPAGREALNRYGLERVRSIDAFGVAMPIAPPEYVVAMKLRWWSISHQDKHLRDIRGMLATSPGQLPDNLVLPWLDAEQRTAWNDCRLRAGEE